MEFRIADTFTDSLAKLTGDEQKAVKTTAFDLQMDPSGSGLSFHKLDRAKDRNFWSVRVGRDIRLIVHRTASSVLLAYVGHHDAAYRWAERRRIERHPKTGAAQLVEIRETVRKIEILLPAAAEATHSARLSTEPALFAGASDDELMGYGVPETWLDDVRRADEDSLLNLAGHLPDEAAEALLELATGGTPDRPVHAVADADPFAHPDAQRRFRLVENVEELERALEYPWEKWTVFLHPAQRRIVENVCSGPARVSGSGRYRKDHRGTPPRRSSRSRASRRSGSLGHVLGHARQRPTREARAPGAPPAEHRRATGGAFDGRHRSAPVRGQLWGTHSGH